MTTTLNDANLTVNKPTDRPADAAATSEPSSSVPSTALTTTPTTPTPTVSATNPALPTSRPPLEKPDFLDPLLLSILCEPRKHDTPNEKKFGNWLIKQLNKMKVKPTLHEFGNISVVIGEGKTLFSCHIDTVHGKDEQTPYQLLFDPNFEQLFLATTPPPANAGKHAKAKPVATCLGADDGAGVWLLLKMIEAKIPGGYIFHRGEECGGQGSKAMATKEADFIKQFTACVAFDRAADFEVIHTQGRTPCASLIYTRALCEQLTKPSMAIKYEPSDRGTFTDSKNYRGLISECVNIGVGYYHQHGPDEYLDYGHLYALLDIVKTVQWDDLERKREPYVEPETVYGGGYGGSGYNGYMDHGYKRGYDAKGKFVGYGKGQFDTAYDANKSGGKTDNVSPFPSTTPPKTDTAPPVKKPSSYLYTSHLEELYENIESANDLVLMYEQDPESTMRSLFRAVIEGRAAEIKAEMLANKFI